MPISSRCRRVAFALLAITAFQCGNQDGIDSESHFLCTRDPDCASLGSGYACVGQYCSKVSGPAPCTGGSTGRDAGQGSGGFAGASGGAGGSSSSSGGTGGISSLPPDGGTPDASDGGTVACSDGASAPCACAGYDDSWWANQTVAPVSWGGNLCQVGTGFVTELTLVHAVRQNPGVLPATFGIEIRPCSLSIPDFALTSDTASYPLIGALAGEPYGLVYSDAGFDRATRRFNSTWTLESTAPGASLRSGRFSLLMGLTMDDPLALWPASWTDLTDGVRSPYEQEDYDLEGNPGTTGDSKALTDATGTYKSPVCNFDNYSIDGSVGRCDHVYESMRMTETQNGSVVDCDNLTGSTDVLYIDRHIVGCHRAETNTACTASDTYLLSSYIPKYTIVGTSTFNAKRLGLPLPANPCDAARAQFP